MKRARLIGGVIGLVYFLGLCALASAQTGPANLANFCGFPSVTFPNQVLNAAAVHASQTVLSTAASAAPTIPTVYAATIIGALVFVEQQPIRARTDGTTVSGNFDGNPYAVNTQIQVCGSDLPRWSAIATSSGGNAILRWNFVIQGR